MQIHVHAAAGNVAGLESELASGTSVDAVDENGRTPLMVAVESPQAGVETLQFLVAAGADVSFVDANGYSILLTALYGSFARPATERLERLRCLVDAGAPLNVASKYGESVLRVSSIRGEFEVVSYFLERGADPAPLGWSPLFFAVAFGSVEEVTELLDQGADLKQIDSWERTPFLLAVHAGRLEVAQLLLSRGCDLSAKGRGGKTAILLAISRDDAAMLRWLISAGCDIEEADDSGGFPLLEAAQNDAVACVQALLSAGANAARRTEFDRGAIGSTSSPEVIELLIRAGEDLSDVPSGQRFCLLGIPPSEVIAVSPARFQAHRDRTFGKHNPERMNNPFWDAMVRTRASAYRGASTFETRNLEKGPVWCFQRFGQSLTRLPDGRYVEIAGEHEDHYDPDFCIYNDVVVHHGDGTFDIYGYPEADFPTTDFHSATLVPPYIYIIGNLGYVWQRRPGETPVYRLHCESWRMEKVHTQGEMPGWIHSHRARWNGNREIVIGGGKIQRDSGGELADLPWQYVLNLDDGAWRRIEKTSQVG